MQDKNQVVPIKASPSLKKSDPVVWSSENKAELAVMIGQVFDLQKQYGKTPDQLTTIVRGFCWALSGYPFERISEAMRQYVLTRADMPTPYDIRQIMDPIKEAFKPDWSIYNRFKKMREDQGEYALGQEEIDYMKVCEEYSLGQAKK